MAVTSDPSRVVNSMPLTTNPTQEAKAQGDRTADARCPHLVFRKVLGPELVADLLDYVVARQHDFAPARVGDGQRNDARLDRATRDCFRLNDLGKFKDMLA